MKANIFRDLNSITEILGRHKKKFILFTMIELAVHTPRYIIRAQAYKLLIDYFVYKNDALIWQIVLFTSLMMLLGFVFTPLTAYFSQRQTELIMKDMRVDTFRKIKKFPVSYFEKFHSGDILARVNRDIDTVKTAMGVYNNFFFHFFSILLKIPYFIYLDWRLAALVTATSILSAFVNLKFVQPMRDLSKERNQKLAKLSEALTENVVCFKIIKMFNLKKHFVHSLDEKMQQIYDTEYKYVKTESRLRWLNELVHGLSYVIVVIFACFLVVRGELDAGSLVSTTMLCYSLSFHFLRVGQNLAAIQKALAGLERVKELFAEKDEPGRYTTESRDRESGIYIDEGVFGYERDMPVLNGINIKVPKNSMAALVGDSGGGKSTLIKILLGQYELDSGQMTINQRPVCEYTLSELRGQSAYVPQDAYIFNGTIRENILLGRPGATEDEMTAASQKANAHSFIMEQPDGYDTIVGERGIKLSGGQRQRIAISRAVLKDAPILLLDEATSSLDSESEQLVQQALNTLMRGKTSVVVAHRLSTVEHAYIIYFIKDGKVAEQGTHKELLDRNSLYAELYYREFAQ